MTVRQTMREHREKSVAGATESIIADDAATKKLAAFIKFKVGDSRLFESICMKVARALIADQISRSEMDQLLDRIETGRRNNSIDHPGAYFMASIKRIYQEAGVPWR